jgi:hypothetical protein
MNTAERFQAVMNFQPVDRLPILEWAPWWDKTIARWEEEGLPKGMENHEIAEYFGLDVLRQVRVGPRIGAYLPKPASHGAPMIHKPEDYYNVRDRGFPDPADSYDLSYLQDYENMQKAGDCAIRMTLVGMFWFPRTLFGIENHLFAFYDHPELYKHMNEDLLEFNIKAIEAVLQYIKPDFINLAEDMSYNNGPMISKDLYDEFMAPYYSKLTAFTKDKGVRIIVDSDGDVHENAFWFEECGINGILPLERQAGCDMVKLREEHPNMIFMGAYDKMVMNKGEEAMRAEFERLLPVAKKGGYFISCDHQTPPGVSLEDYRLYIKLFNEYALVQ